MNSKQIGSESNTDWQRVCHKCSTALEPNEEECPKCGARVIDIESRIHFVHGKKSPEEKRTLRKK